MLNEPFGERQLSCRHGFFSACAIGGKDETQCAVGGFLFENFQPLPPFWRIIEAHPTARGRTRQQPVILPADVHRERPVRESHAQRVAGGYRHILVEFNELDAVDNHLVIQIRINQTIVGSERRAQDRFDGIAERQTRGTRADE